MLPILGHIFLFCCMSVTCVLNARCAGYPFIASVKMVWGLVNISPRPAGMSEGGRYRREGFSHLPRAPGSCRRCFSSAQAQAGVGLRCLQHRRLWSPLPPALGPCGVHVLQCLDPEHTLSPSSAIGRSAFLPVPGFCRDGQQLLAPV